MDSSKNEKQQNKTKILNFLKRHPNHSYECSEIAEELNLSSVKTSASLRSLHYKGEVEKVTSEYWTRTIHFFYKWRIKTVDSH